jgi:hypothetical protein
MISGAADDVGAPYLPGIKAAREAKKTARHSGPFSLACGLLLCGLEHQP